MVKYQSDAEGFQGKNFLLAIIAIIFIVALSYLLFFKSFSAPTGFSLISEQLTGVADKNTGDGYGIEGVRKDYGIPLGVFEELSRPPSDFSKLVSLMHSNSFATYTFFGEAYYLQPEFYTSFPGSALSYWKQPSTTHYGAMGYGFFPASQRISIKKGKTVTARFFLHTGFGVQSWQGMSVKTMNENENLQVETIPMQQDILLGPTFPKFSREWAKAIDVKIHAPNAIRPGTYYIKFFASFPSQEKSSEWKQKHKKYFDAAMAGAAVSHTIELEVK